MKISNPMKNLNGKAVPMACVQSLSLFAALTISLAVCCVCLTAEGAETVELAPHTFTIPDGYEL